MVSRPLRGFGGRGFYGAQIRSGVSRFGCLRWCGRKRGAGGRAGWLVVELAVRSRVHWGRGRAGGVRPDTGGFGGHTHPVVPPRWPLDGSHRWRDGTALRHRTWHHFPDRHRVRHAHTRGRDSCRLGLRLRAQGVARRALEMTSLSSLREEALPRHSSLARGWVISREPSPARAVGFSSFRAWPIQTSCRRIELPRVGSSCRSSPRDRRTRRACLRFAAWGPVPSRVLSTSTGR